MKTPLPDELVELPFGSNLFILPDRVPIGYDLMKNQFIELKEYQGEKVFAVSSFMAPAYLQILRSAYKTKNKAKRLSLYSYSAAGWKNGKFYASGVRIEKDTRQDLVNFNLKLIEKKAHEMLKKYSKNRLVAHLIEKCVLCYGCPAARNFVMQRWEAPIPTSPFCNSSCLGCISKQPEASGVRSSQDRIDFVPTPDEIAEFTVPHLEKAERAVVSFGQGCEGEPLLVGDVIEEAIKMIRKKTCKGIINLNTNGSLPDVVERLCKAGLQSIRVSINSFQAEYYNAYYKPKNYLFSDVIETLKTAKKNNAWTSINYLVFPGFTDSKKETELLIKHLKELKINMIQTRNFNIDPEWYIDELSLNKKKFKASGIKKWVDIIKEKAPWVKLGYFNPPKEEMLKKHY